MIGLQENPFFILETPTELLKIHFSLAFVSHQSDSDFALFFHIILSKMFIIGVGFDRRPDAFLGEALPSGLGLGDPVRLSRKASLRR